MRNALELKLALLACAGLSAVYVAYALLTEPGGGHPFGHGLGLFGTLLMLINVVLIWLYTLSCHSCRHITGGRLRHFSKHPVRYRLWTFVSRLNASHAKYA